MANYFLTQFAIYILFYSTGYVRRFYDYGCDMLFITVQGYMAKRKRSKPDYIVKISIWPCDKPSNH